MLKKQNLIVMLDSIIAMVGTNVIFQALDLENSFNRLSVIHSDAFWLGIIIAVSAFAINCRYLIISSASGYIIGWILGVLFDSEWLCGETVMNSAPVWHISVLVLLFIIASVLEYLKAEKTNRKELMITVASFLFLICSYFAIEYLLFPLSHGAVRFLMRVSAVSICVSSFKKLRILPIFTSVGFAFGWVLGKLLEVKTTDPGGGSLSNDWIWHISISVLFVMLGIIVEIFQRNINKKRKLNKKK